MIDDQTTDDAKTGEEFQNLHNTYCLINQSLILNTWEIISDSVSYELVSYENVYDNKVQLCLA